MHKNPQSNRNNKLQFIAIQAFAVHQAYNIGHIQCLTTLL